MSSRRAILTRTRTEEAKAYRRARTIDGGEVTNSLTCSHSLCVFVEL